MLELRDTMIIAAITFRLHASWVHRLKEKRMIVKRCGDCRKYRQKRRNPIHMGN